MYRSSFDASSIDPFDIAIPTVAVQSPLPLIQALVDTHPGLIYMGDRAGQYRWANPMFTQFFGLAGTLADTTAATFIADPVLRAQWLREDRQVIQTGRDVMAPEEMYRDWQGKPHWLQWRRRPVELLGERYVLGVGLDVSERRQAEEVLWNVVQGVCTELGDSFFPSLVQALAQALEIDCALVGEVRSSTTSAIQTVVVYSQGHIMANFAYDIAHTPNERLVGNQPCIYPCRVQQQFPRDRVLQTMQAESYLGMPLVDSAGRVLGIMAVIGHRAVPNIRLATEVLRIFALRAAVELERRQSEALHLSTPDSDRPVDPWVRELARAIAHIEPSDHPGQTAPSLPESPERQHQALLVEAAVDGMAILDPHCHVYLNQTYGRLFGYDPVNGLMGQDWRDLYPPDQVDRIERDILPTLAERSYWRGEAVARRRDGHLLDLEITLNQTPDGRLIWACRDISDRKQAERQLQQTNQKLQGWVTELEQRNQEMSLISEIGDFLQASLTVEDACKAVATLIQALFPNCSGGLFINYPADGSVEAIATWGASMASQTTFTPRDCWALRRGRLHWVAPHHHGLFCAHIKTAPYPAASFCAPMTAHGETLGLLYLEAQEPDHLPESKCWLARAVAEQIALSLANLRLQETLQNQSIRDPLTGLYNRRHLEKSFDQLIHRACRMDQSIGVIMLDIDHFKQFNDTFGHNAGDMVLQEVSRLLLTLVRSSDVVCRYGGEEITLLLPDAGVEETVRRAEEIRNALKCLTLHYRGQDVGRITASLGVACFPNQGTTGQAVLQAADGALYRAKMDGRDRCRTAPTHQL